MAFVAATPAFRAGPAVSRDAVCSSSRHVVDRTAFIAGSPLPHHRSAASGSGAAGSSIRFFVSASGDVDAKFRVYPKLVGRWLNDCRVFDSTMAEVKHTASEVDFLYENGVYKIKSLQDDGKGNRVQVSFLGTPISDGVMDFHVENAPETLAGRADHTCTCPGMMRSREHADRDILINDIYNAEGRLVAIELLTLIDDDTRIQSGQRFHPEDGEFAGSWLYKGVRL